MVNLFKKGTCAIGLGLWATLYVSACAGSSGGGGVGAGGGSLPDGATAAPAVRGISVTVENVRLSTAPTERYGVPVQQALTPAETGLVEAMTGPGWRHDPALSRIAREVARTAPSRTNVPTALITGLTSWVGLYDPPPQLAISDLPAEGAPCGEQVSPSCREAIVGLAQAVKESLRGRKTSGMYFGAGVTTLADGSMRLVVSLTERGAALEPMAKSLPMGGRAEIRGRLLGGRKDPVFEVFDPQGKIAPLQAKTTRGEFVGSFQCGQARGAYQVEVLAEGTYGPEVVANFPLYCGEEPPGALRVEIERIDAGVDADAIARANFAALNDTRARQGLPLLQWDNQAAAIALGHSEDMVRSGFVGHSSPTTGDVDARFQRAGVKSAVIRENVARGYGPWAIHQGLMQSPGHRVNILATDVTHVGIGVVVAPPDTDAKDAPRPVFLTQNFYAKLGADAPVANMPEALRGRVDEIRRQKGLRPMGWDRALSEAAQALAEGLASGDESRAQKQYDARVDKLKFRGVETHRVLAPSFAALDGFNLWLEEVVGAVGIGVAKVTKGKDAGTIVAIVAVGKS